MGFAQSVSSGMGPTTAGCEATYAVYASMSSIVVSMSSRVRPRQCSCRRQSTGNLACSQGLRRRLTSPL
eukprot:14730258-Heterocapsa_arctica.AAC.1